MSFDRCLAKNRKSDHEEAGRKSCTLIGSLVYYKHSLLLSAALYITYLPAAIGYASYTFTIGTPPSDEKVPKVYLIIPIYVCVYIYIYLKLYIYIYIYIYT